MSSYTEEFLTQLNALTNALDVTAIDRMVTELTRLRDRNGRLFVIGNGGGAANASHAVNDFRKVCGIQAYAPSDNVAELTARVNDEGWETAYLRWLQVSNMSPSDLLFVLSVGGGSHEHEISMNIVRCVQFAKDIGATVCGIVGRDGGYTLQAADVCVVVPSTSSGQVTPYVESIQAVLCHLFVGHPNLRAQETKWESISR